MTKYFSHLVWLGAGMATEPENLFELAERTTLFEAREAACLLLKKQHPQENIVVKQMVLTAEGTPVEFTEYNLAEYSAVQAATSLKILFPGIKPLQSEQVKSIAVTEAINVLALESNNNLLVVDIADSNLALLNALHQNNQLNCFGEIHIQAGNEPLYAGAATTAEITAFLQEQGYLLQQTNSHDPDLPWLVFGLNPLWQTLQQAQQTINALAGELEQVKQQLKAAQQQLDSAQAQTTTNKQEAQKQETQKQEEHAAKIQQASEQQHQLGQQLNKKIAEHEALQQVLSATKTAAEKSQADLTARIATMDMALKRAQQQLESAQAQTTTQLQQQAESELQQVLEQKIQKMFADQAQLLTKEVGGLKNHINTGLSNSARQLEAFMGIQNYLEKGVKPLSFHGWPISPDIGLYITGLIDANNYDVIIEFGSGTSTVLMAKALISKQRGAQTKTLGNTSKSNEIAVQETPFADLPARIVTFEHNNLYHGKTTQALQDNGVDHLVDLVYAPLVDYQYKDGSQYLYYSCNDKLQELARIFKGRKANILVLVDGPPGATNKNARFPALPHLLNTLTEHSFTVIMDDYKRAEEKEIITLWKNILEERSLFHELIEVVNEKGLAHLSVN
jgi:hypothetical protein